MASPADNGLGTFGTVATSNGAKQITYNGSPLYTFKGAKALATKGNGVGGVWHVIKMSESNIVGGAELDRRAPEVPAFPGRRIMTARDAVSSLRIGETLCVRAGGPQLPGSDRWCCY